MVKPREITEERDYFQYTLSLSRRPSWFAPDRRFAVKTAPSLILLGIVLQINGCTITSVFPLIGNTTEIVVEDVSNKQVNRITDPAKISQIVAFVHKQEKGWRSPWYDPLIPKIRMVFYQDRQKLGTLSIGADFFSSGAYFKPASEQEIEQVMRLIEVDHDRFFKR
jgi:hypothetical protein